ncbi:MAG: hypothetical protein WCD47_12470 [Candidatus Sulfotelmatobacter sp.]
MSLMTVKTMGKRGNKRMRKNRSRAESVAWPLMGGPKRKKDLDADVLERFALGISLTGNLARRMADAKLPPEDGEVYFVLSSTPDFKQQPQYHPVTSGHLSNWTEVIESAKFVETHSPTQCPMVGLVVCIRDREKADWVVFPRPFIVSNPNATALLENAVNAIRDEKRVTRWR